MILATNGSWIPGDINGKPVESKPFILPLIYEMEAGCNPQRITTTDTGRKYKELPNDTATDLLYILDFEDSAPNHINQLDCILLRPLHVFSQN